jgi:hypothetical protein
MRCKTFLAIHAITCAASLIAAGTQKTTNPACGKGPRPIRFTARHIEPNGIGYNQGYTTLEGFISHTFSQNWVPFLDLRGHVFNNGKLASNAGLGCRYIGVSSVFGINAYYDYRNTKRQHYNQVSAGLEALGRVWDFRINGYLPVGRKHSPFFDTRFDRFKEHNILIRRKRDVALKAANAEAGMHVDHFDNAPLYFAAGPYYLTGGGKTSWGGSLRARVDLFEYVTLEANTSYDTIFHWIGQGQISVNYSVGPKRKVQKGKHSFCGQAIDLSKRAVQRVDRMEIIPVKREHERIKAINPATDKPWVVWFVDNTSSSNGTIESPFPTLVQAQNASSPNQIIYVFPGDGTTKGMDAGITLQNSQLFWGASVKHNVPTTLGTFTIPPMSSRAPNIENPAGNAVTLSNKNTVSGFTISVPTDGNNGIFGDGINNFYADHNTFLTSTTITTNGIALINLSGKVVVRDSLFNGFSNNQPSVSNQVNGNGIYVELDAGHTLNQLSVNKNAFLNINNPNGNSGGNGIFANILGGTINSLNASENLFNNMNDGDGIFVQLVKGVLNSFNFSNNAFDNISNFGIGVAISSDNTSTIGDIIGKDNAFSDLSNNASGIAFFGTGGSIDNVNLSDNLFSHINSGTGIFADYFGTVINNFNITDSSFVDINNTSEGILFLNSGSVTKLSILDNSFSGAAGIIDGYAVEVSVFTGGKLCLEFIGNTATPADSPVPYLFAQSGTGVFNRTVGSDSSTNTGTIVTTPGVGAPGTCQ